MNLKTRKNTTVQQRRRRGAVVVEAAFCIPVFGMLLFGTLEIANAIYVRQVVTAAAYEGVRVAAAPGGTQAAVNQRVQELLGTRELSNGTIEVSPDLGTPVPQGTQLRVTVSVPTNANAISPMRFFSDRTISVTAVMVKL